MTEIFYPIAILGIAALAIGGGFLLRYKKQQPSDWEFDAWTKNTTLDKPPAAGSILSFKFPSKDGVHSIDRVIKPGTLGKQIFMKYEITGNAPVFWSTEDEPGQIGLKFANATIFSNHMNRKDLALGRHTLAVSLTPENWQTINGIPCNNDAGQIELFNKAVKSDSSISICFGGINHGYAHGVYLTAGSADFKLLSFSL